MNYVSWNPVVGATNYKVTVYEEGVYKGGKSASGNSCTDTDLVNGKRYTYYVEAVSKSDPAATPAREVFVKNSRGEASVTAIVPPAGTSALELPAYEGGYNGSPKEVKDDQFVVSAENVNVTVDKGNVYVNIPTKAYLSYSVNIFDTDLSREINGITPAGTNSVSDFNSNNVTLAKRFAVTSAGKYKVVVNVFSSNGIYKTSEVEAGEIEIAKLDLSPETGTLNAEYLSDGKTARISFTPAQKDGVNVPTGWYKVYRQIKGEYATTPVSGAVKENVSFNETIDKTTYYIDDVIADATKVYVYTIVVENDGKYGTAKQETLNIDSGLSSLSKSVNAKYLYAVNHFETNAKNTARIWFDAPKVDDDYVPVELIKVYRNESNESNESGKLEQTEITSATKKVTSTVSVSTDGKNTVVYYIEEEIADVTKDYEYTVFAERNGERVKIGTGTLGKETENSINFTVTGSQKSHVDESYQTVYEASVEWTIRGTDLKKDEIKSITLYQAIDRNSSVNVLVDEVTKPVPLASISEAESPYTVTTPVELIYGSTVYLLVKAERDGHEVTYKSYSSTIQK